MKGSIKSKILVSHLVLVMLITVSIGVSSYYLMKDLLLEKEQEHLQFMAKGQAKQLERKINDKKQLLDKIADSKEAAVYFERYDVARLREFLVSFKHEFNILCYVNEAGQQELKSVDGVLQENFISIKGTKIFQEAMASPNEVMISEPFYDKTLQAPAVQMAIAKRQYFGNAFIGMITGTVKLSEMTRDIIEERTGDTGFSTVVNNQGIILGHVKPEIVLTSLEGEGEPTEELMANVKNSKAGVHSANLMGFDSINAYAPLHGINWSIIVTMPQKEFLATPYLLRNYILIFNLVILVIGWIIAARLSRSIVKPLLTLTDATKRISQRKFNEHIEIHTGDETEILAGSFNRMQKDLQKTTVKKEFVENIINSLLDSLIVVTEKGVIETVNVATYMLLEFEEDELIGKPIETILADGEFKELVKKSNLKSLVVKNKLSELECSYKTRHGEEIPIHFSGSVICEAFGDLDGVACIGIDIRKQKEAEAEKKKWESQLLQSQKMEAIGTLTGGIAHDFNNIISTMLGFISLLSNKAVDDEDKEYLEILQASGERAAGLVSQMLAYSRANDAERQPVRIAELIKEALKMMRAVTPATIHIKQDIEAVDVFVMANSTQIHQVVMNLCNNSIHAMKNSGGELEARLTMVSDNDGVPHDLKPNVRGFVKFTVTDTGTGMTPEVKQRIFDPFFTTKGVGEGTGLGMSVVHGIVNRHDGSIIIDSVPGKGTKIEIYFPISREKTAPSPDKFRFTSAKQAQHIMIVEDEKSLSKFCQIALNRMGYKTTVFNDPKEALADFESDTENYDLVYTDQTMPNITGLELSQKLLRMKPSLPIVLVSGHHADDFQSEARLSGVREILMKPVNVKRLSHLLNEIFSEQTCA